MSKSFSDSNIVKMTVNVGDVGNPDLYWDKTVLFRFRRFKDLPTTKGHCVKSSKVSLFGQQWELWLYPGGSLQSRNGFISLFLKCFLIDSTIKVDCSFSIKNCGHRNTKFSYCEKISCWGLHEFADRSTVLRNPKNAALINGDLIVEVKLNHLETQRQFMPKNPFGEKMLKLFMDEKSSDISFGIGKNCIKTGKKKVKTSYEAVIPAHCFILKISAPLLANLCESSSGGSAPVHITQVDPTTFHWMLYYAYGGNIPPSEFRARSKDLIDAADRFEITDLKLEAEVWCVKSTTITVDNVMENLLYAEAKNLALLKEAVMDFFAENGNEVLAKVDLKDVPNSRTLFNDLLAATARGKNKVASEDCNDSSKFGTMRISTLRKKLHDRGLSIDGSRETLVATLTENNLESSSENE